MQNLLQILAQEILIDRKAAGLQPRGSHGVRRQVSNTLDG